MRFKPIKSKKAFNMWYSIWLKRDFTKAANKRWNQFDKIYWNLLNQINLIMYTAKFDKFLFDQIWKK